MEIIAISKSVRQSPRKLRLVADAAKKMSPAGALERILLLPKSAALPIAKTIKSALANAENNFKLDPAKIRIKNIVIDGGFRMKRRDKSHSDRFNRGLWQKPTAHIKVILESL